MDPRKALYQFCLRLADSSSILGHRLGEWCGHGPVLEQDIAMTNIALDLIGQARNYYQYAAKIDGAGKTEDDLAYLREGGEYANYLLLEQPNGDFAMTIVRQYLFDVYHRLFLEGMSKSSDLELQAFAVRHLKEVQYHAKWSGGWVERLGDGTPESFKRTQMAIDNLWRFTGEFFKSDEIDREMHSLGIAPDLAALENDWKEEVTSLFNRLKLLVPNTPWMLTGGKKGSHTEHLGYILAEMQLLQRTHPGLQW